MNKNLLLLFILFCAFSLNAQTTKVLANWEDKLLTMNGSFGNGTFADSLFSSVDNPNPTGINTSANVQLWSKASDAATWGGFFFDLDEVIDLSGSIGKVCFDVYADHEINVRLKIEKSTDGGPDASFDMMYTSPNEWETICYDVFGTDTEGGIQVLKGYSYSRITLFPEFGTTPTEIEEYYIDNIVQEIEGGPSDPDPIVIADWDDVDLAMNGSFGNGSFGDSLFSILTNPNPSGINTSDSVQFWGKAIDAATWGGFFYDLPEPIDLSGSVGKVCFDVYTDHEINVRLKIEQSTDGGPDSSFDQMYTSPGEWQTICYDLFGENADGDIEITKGFNYNRITLFPEFGNVPAEVGEYYIDNIVKIVGGEIIPGNIISDYEPSGTTAEMGASFGNGSFGDSLFIVTSNPSSDPVNSSENVQLWCKANDAENWAGFYIDVDTLDFTGTDALVCISVYSESPSNVRMKLEQSETGPDLNLDAAYDTPGEWQELCFDFSMPDVNGNEGLGNIYKRITIFPGFGSVPTENQCYYIDNIYEVTNGGGAALELLGNIIQASSDHTILADLLTNVDMWGAVNSSGVTVFAPTNEAFESLPTSEMDALMNNTDNTLYNFLLHHVTNDSITSDMLTSGLEFVMRNGQNGIVTGANQVNGADVVTADVPGVNGILHITNAVLDYPQDPEVIVYGDYETPETTLEWNYFSVPGPPTFTAIENPDPDDINNSATVALYKKYPFGDPWQGIYSDFERPLNLYGDLTTVCMDLWSDHEGFVRLKLEKSLTNAADVSWVTENLSPNQWNTVCWDLTEPNITDEGIQTNNIYTRAAMFFDFEDNQPLPEDSVSYYFDNFRVINTNPMNVQEINELFNIEVYPNPVADWLTISSDISFNSAFIYDVNGHIMVKVDESSFNRINVSNLVSGLYFIQLRNNNSSEISTVKFIKK